MQYSNKAIIPQFNSIFEALLGAKYGYEVVVKHRKQRSLKAVRTLAQANSKRIARQSRISELKASIKTKKEFRFAA